MSQNRLPVDGVALIVEGQKKFISDLNAANASWEKTVSGFDSGAPATAKASKGLTSVGSSAGGAASGLLAMVGAGSVAIAGLGILVAAVGKAGQAIAKLSGQLFDLAVESSKIDGIRAQFANLTADVTGGSNSMLRALTDATGGMISNKEAMLSFNNAAALVNKDFAKKLPESLALITKVAAGTGESVNFLLDSFVRGVGRVSPQIIDNLKVQVTLAETTAFASEMFGKEAEALTVLEKQTALTELTLAKLEAKFGDMEDPTQSLASQTAVLKANMANISDTLGSALEPAFSTLLASINGLVTAFSEAISEGGALFPVLVGIGAAASLMADGLAAAVDWVTSKITGLGDDISGGIAGTISEAVNWGFELIAAFAQGIIDGVSTVLIGAMNFLSNMLSSWLLGASPPKVAPGIEQWGIQLMDTYLKGMTEADFGILKDVQGPLKKILEGPAFANVSKSLAESLAGGDRAGFLETVGEAGGPLGDALKELAVANFDLADSVTAVNMAEEALASSREKLLSSQAGINKATVEYNRLLRAGASETELQTQLGLINAAEDNMRMTVGQVGAQEDALDAAKKRQEELEAEEKLQQNIVDQLLAVNDALKKQEQEKAKAGGAGAAKGAKKGAAGIAPLIPEVAAGVGAGGLGAGIGAAIDAMKAKMAEKFKGMFDPVKDSWDAAMLGISTAWQTFKTTVGEVWDGLKEKYPILQDLQDWVTDLPGLLETLGTALSGAFLTALTAVGDYVDVTLKPLFDSFVDVTLAAWDLALVSLTALWNENILPALKDVWKEITDFTMPILTTLGNFLTDLWENVISKLADGFTNVTKALKSLTNWFNEWTVKLRDMKKAVEPIENNSPSPVELGIMGINKQLQVLATTRMPALVNMGMQMRGAMAPIQQLAPQSSTSIVNNMGGNTFNNGQSEAAFHARVQQSMRRTLRS